MNLFNLTGYGAVCLPSMGRGGQDLAMAVTAVRFLLPHPGDSPQQPLQPAEHQPDPPIADVYCGPAGKSGLRTEGQTAFYRPATDIVVAGHARSLNDEPVTRLQVSVSVGNCLQRALVVGDRIWDAGMSA